MSVSTVSTVDQVEIALGKATRPGVVEPPQQLVDRGGHGAIAVGLSDHVEEIAEPEELVGESDHESRVA